MSRLHLGIDYGTSASKLVLRNFEAPGGEVAYLLEHEGQFRYSSAVAFDEGRLLFNVDEDDPASFKSMKMRFAEDLTGEFGEHFFGVRTPIPDGVTSEDLVTLTVWRLISIGHQEALRILGLEDFRMGMTLGLPISFLDRDDLREAFLRIARVSYYLYRQFGVVKVDSLDLEVGLECLKRSRHHIGQQQPVTGQRIRNWIRSETEASMLWSFESPAIPPYGQYFSVDIGAGTTDCNAFQVTSNVVDGHRMKRGLCFFGANSIPYGVDALSQLDEENLAEGYARVRSGLVGAARKAFVHIRGNGFTINQWRKPKLILLGGGSLDSDLCMKLTPHPMENWKEETIEPIDLMVPTDLVRTDGSEVSREDVIFTSVAYGLAQIGAAAPEAALPNEVQPVVKHALAELPEHETMYWE